MRQQIIIATFALLLVAAFLAVWASALPGAPAVPFAAPLGPTTAPTPTPSPTRPQAETPPTPTARPRPTPTATAMPPTPTPLPPTPPAPPPPTATPIPPTPTATPPPPTPTPAPLFITLTKPVDIYTLVHTDSVDIAGNTLPWSTVLVQVRVESPAQDQEIFARANGDGAFDIPVQLAVGNNAITIITYHTTSDEEKKELRVVDYNPNPRRLYVTVTEPNNGAVVTEQHLTIIGRTLPGARVTVNKNILAEVAENGEWQAMFFLEPGKNEITVIASHNGLRDPDTTITVTYNPQ